MRKQYEDPIAIGSTIKALDKNRIGGYLIAFTDENRADLYGEFFDAKTDLQIGDFPIKGIPTVFHHGFDETIGTRGIGRVDTVKIDDKGVWVEAILKEHEDYITEIMALVDKGVLGWSSGAWPQAVRVSDNGHIDVWPVIEASATHTPAAPFDTAIASVRSLKPVSLRGQARHDMTTTPDREVTVRTSGGAVSSVHVEYSGTDANTNTTHTHTDIGEPEVDKTKLADSLQKVTALKMLDDEARAEILDLIRNEISDAIGVMGEEMRMEDELDDEAKAAADEEAAAAAADALDEETKNASGDEVKAAVRSAMDKPAVLSAIGLAWVKGYSQAREAKLERKRSALAQAINEANMSGNGKSLGNGAKGTLGANGGSNISVSEDLRYAHLTPFQMALGVKILQSTLPESMQKHAKLGALVGDDYARHVTHKMANFMDKGGFKNVSDTITLRDLSPFKSFKADEINASDITGQGLEWITVGYDNSVWERVRDETQLFDLMMSAGMRNQPFPQGVNSVVVPTDTASGTVTYRAEANDLNADNAIENTVVPTAFGTGSVTITGREHVLAYVRTDRVDEVTVVDIVQWADADMLTTLAESLEDALINGDTTTGTTNINSDGTATSAAPSRELWLAWDGLRHHFLIDNTSLSSDHATGALAAATFLNTRNLLPGRVRNRRKNLLFVMDYGTEAKARQISELFTRDVAYNDATLFTGVLPPIDGVQIYTSGFLRSADTDGKVTGAGNVTNTGTLMCVYAPYWAYANQRSINIETARGWRGAQSGSTLLVATVVHGFGARSINASAGTYNIAIA